MIETTKPAVDAVPEKFTTGLREEWIIADKRGRKIFSSMAVSCIVDLVMLALKSDVDLRRADLNGAFAFVQRGSRHPIYVYGDATHGTTVDVGNERRSLADWLSTAELALIAFNYSNGEIAEYSAHFRHIASLVDIHNLTKDVERARAGNTAAFDSGVQAGRSTTARPGPVPIRDFPSILDGIFGLPPMYPRNTRFSSLGL